MNRIARVSRRAQRGVILFVALIVLVAMSLTGIALIRSVDTNVLVAGNLAFRQGATAAADNLCGPLHAFLDRTGNLLVTDSQNDRVLRYDVVRARVAPTVASLSPESARASGRAFTLNSTDVSPFGIVTTSGASSPCMLFR